MTRIVVTTTCGKDRMLNEVHAPERQCAMPIRYIIAHMRHEGCGGRQGGWSC